MPGWYEAILAVVALAGAGLLVWALRGDRSRGRKRCPKCWYDMTGAGGLVCPECGRDAGSETSLLRTRRSRARFLVGLGLLVGAGAAIPGHALATKGWAAVPTPVLIAVVPWVSLNPTFPDGSRNGFAEPFARAVQVPLPQWEQRLLAWRLEACLRDSDPKQRGLAASYIQSSDVQGDNVVLDSCIPALVRQMDDADADAAYMTACAVAGLGVTDPAMVPVWERLLASSPHELVRSTAAAMLWRMGSAGDSSKTIALLRALLDPSDQVVPQAVYSLGFLRDPAAVPALILAVNSKMPGVCQAACHSIAGFEDAGAAAVPALLGILREEGNPMVGAAVVALGRIGPGAKEAVPDLLRVLQAALPQNRGGNTAVALGRIGDSRLEVIEALRVGLTGGPGVQRSCVEALYRLGWVPRDIDRARIEAWVGDKDAAMRVWARMLLARAEGTLDGEVDRLISLLNGQDWWVSEAAILALESLGARAERALPSLRALCPPPSRKGVDSDTQLKRQAADPAVRHITAALEARSR